jgi:hypothetical protein
MRRLLFIAGLLWLSVSTAEGQDPVKVDPKHYKVAFENDQLRVLSITFDARDRSVMHERGPGLALYATEYHLRATIQDGMTREYYGKSGQVIWTEPKKLAVENLADKPFEEIFVELKGRRAVTPVLFSGEWPKDFSKSVSQDQEAILSVANRVKNRQPISDQDAFRATNAAKDLKLKTYWIEQRRDRPPMVRVSVNTIGRGGRGVHGCEVWYVPYAWQDDTSRRERFDKLSTPTSKLLSVGHYVMWTRSSGKEGERKPVSPGDDGKADKEVDLPAPR